MSEDNRTEQRIAEGRYFIDEAAKAIATQLGRGELWCLNFKEAMMRAAVARALVARDPTTWLPIEPGRGIGISAMVRRDDVNEWLASSKAGYEWSARTTAAPSGAPEKAEPEVPPADDEQGEAAPPVTTAAPKKKPLVAWQAVLRENWPTIAKDNKKPPARQVMKWLRDNGPRDVFPSGPKIHNSLQWMDTGGETHTLTIKRLGTVLSEWRRCGKIPA